MLEKNITALKSHLQNVPTKKSDFKEVITTYLYVVFKYVIFGKIANVKAAI